MKASPSNPAGGRAACEPVVYIVDDDVGMNDALQDLLRSVGLRTRAFLSAEAFLTTTIDTAPGCVVMDVRLRGTNGLEVQREMERRGMCLPVVFITGHGDIEMSVRAMKAGAVDFLPKPFRDQDLLDAVAEGISADRKKRHVLQCSDDLRSRLATLSDREREVMTLAASGLMNKQIAATIGISEVTIKIHRSRAMRKMAARTFADLVKMALELELELPMMREPATTAQRRHMGAESGTAPQWAPGY
ncbi:MULTISPECIES: response regulator [unclassified Cupriavidus]|uniref:response regulator transcription factor n=1 Tax=unclassified Cupriavidus TaxID=2640874 RepID=UPI003213565D